MIQLFLNNTRVQVKSGSNIKLTSENPYFKSGSSYTYEVELPLSIPMNKAFFGYIDRIDVRKQIVTYDARLMCDNRIILIGTAVLINVTESAAKVQLLGVAASYNFKNKMDETYIDELDLGDFASETWDDYSAGAVWPGDRPGADGQYHPIENRRVAGSAYGYGSNHWSSAPDYLFDGSKGWVMFPIYNATADVVCNDWVYRQAATNSTNYTLQFEPNRGGEREDMEEPPCRIVAPQPMVWLIAKKIAAATGKELPDENNALLKDDFLRRIFIASAAGYAQYKMSLPHWTVNEFWNEVEQAFGVVVYMPEDDDRMAILKRRDYYETKAKRIVINKVVDEFQVDIDDDTNKDISVDNVGFESFDSDSEDFLSDGVIDSARYIDTFDDIESIRNYYLSLSGTEKTNWLLSIKDVIFRCKDGRQYVYFAETYDNPQFREVNQFRNRIVNEKKDEVDISLKFVPCKFIEHEMRILRYSERHAGAESVVIGKAPVKILSRPDRSDTAYLYEQISETPNLEYIISGDEDALEKESPENLIYIAIIPESNPGGTVSFNINNVNYNNQKYPEPRLRTKTIWDISRDIITREGDGFSLSLVNIKDEANLYRETVEGTTIINSKIRECIKFVASELPNPGDIYLIRNKTFVCEKIEADLKEDGMDKILTGYFYRIDL